MSGREPVGSFIDEELLRKALGAARMGVWWWDLTTDAVVCSPQVEQILGLAPGSFGGTVDDYFERVHPDDRQEVESRLSDSIRSGETEVFIRHRVVQPNGQVRWLDYWGAVEQDGSGNPTVMLGTAVDSTDQARTEEALRSVGEGSFQTGRAFFESLVERMSEVLGVRYAFAGEVVPPGVKRARSVAVWAGGQAAPPFEYDLAGTPCQNVLTQGLCAYPRDVQREFPDDTMLVELGVESYLGVPLHGSTGQALGLLVVLDDQEMPETQVAGRILRFFAARAGAELERLQKEQELLQAQKLETVGRLAGGIAHDFNNLLTVTMAAADLGLAREPEDEQLRGLLEQIRSTAERGGELTSRLLTFARKQVLQLDVIDLDGLIEKAAPVLLRRLIGEHLALRLDLRGSVSVQADAARLEQVLVNLVVNARDAMPNGGELTVTTERSSWNGRDHVRWTVSDTGCGMSQADREQVFEPFFTTKPPGKGTGLGLSTCFGIVEQHGGRIELESTVGQGTDVSVWLPVFEASAETEPSPAPPTAARGQETILLVEDDVAVRDLARRVLENQGYTVLMAADGVEALGVARAAPRVDLLLSDVIMPRLGGRELAQQLSEERPGLKVLFMSGYTQDEVQVEEVLRDEVRLLKKPYSLTQLAGQVRAALDA